MSTLKVATIQDTSGNNSSTPAGIAAGTAKAWISFNGTGTPSITQSFNVSSITDVNTGRFNINLTNAVLATACVVAGVAKQGNADNGDQKICVGSFDAGRLPTTSSFPLTIVSGTASLEDVGYIAAAVFSD
tara:strand:- start:1605 stop:1997 length:393 start_codon:yes stop_codon:yes gene_type:complete